MIWRSCTCASFLLVLSAGTAPTALAADDNASAVLADCGSPDLAASAVDSCLERVRVLDETNPSPELQSLEAQLEQRESGGRTARRQPRPLQSQASPPPSDTAQYDSQPVVVDNPHYLPPAAAEPDQTGSAQTEEPEAGRPDMRADDRRRETVDSGADRPPPGINDDQPPVADPPDGATSRDEDSDPPDGLQ